MLEAIRSESRNGSEPFSPDDVISQVVRKLNGPGPIRVDDALKRAVWCCFNSLLRTGVIGLGDGKVQDGLPIGRSWPNGSVRLTPEGEEVLEQASRDPINVPGYLAYLDQEVRLDAVTRDYVQEALNTYRACCYKATAVLIGAAVENLTMILRDTLRDQLTASGAKVPKELADWRAKTVLEAIADKVIPDLTSESKKTRDEVLRHLSDDVIERLRPAAAEFRKTRNDAGHPASLDPVNQADVHANSLLFPSAAKLLRSLTEWVADYYKSR